MAPRKNTKKKRSKTSSSNRSTEGLLEKEWESVLQVADDADATETAQLIRIQESEWDAAEQMETQSMADPSSLSPSWGAVFAVIAREDVREKLTGTKDLIKPDKINKDVTKRIRQEQQILDKKDDLNSLISQCHDAVTQKMCNDERKIGNFENEEAQLRLMPEGPQRDRMELDLQERRLAHFKKVRPMYQRILATFTHANRLDQEEDPFLKEFQYPPTSLHPVVAKTVRSTIKTISKEKEASLIKGRKRRREDSPMRAGPSKRTCFIRSPGKSSPTPLLMSSSSPVSSRQTSPAPTRLQTPSNSRTQSPASQTKAPDSGKKTPDSGKKTPDSGKKTPDSRTQSTASGTHSPASAPALPSNNDAPEDMAVDEPAADPPAAAIPVDDDRCYTVRRRRKQKKRAHRVPWVVPAGQPADRTERAVLAEIAKLGVKRVDPTAPLSERITRQSGLPVEFVLKS